MNLKNLSIFTTVLAVTSVTCAMSAQAPASTAPAAQQPAAQTTQAPTPGTVQDNGKVVQTPPVEEKPDPLKRRLSDRQAFEQRKAVKAEMSKEYVKWLNEDECYAESLLREARGKAWLRVDDKAGRRGERREGREEIENIPSSGTMMISSWPSLHHFLI